MARVVDACDGDQGTHQPGVDVDGVSAAGVEVQGEEADRDVEDLAGDLVAVDEAAPLSVDWDEAQRAWRAGDVTPVGGRRRGSGGGREVAILLWGFSLFVFLFLRRSLLGGGAGFPFRGAAAGTGAGVDGRVGVGVRGFTVFLVDGSRGFVALSCRASCGGKVTFAVAAPV